MNPCFHHFSPAEWRINKSLEKWKVCFWWRQQSRIRIHRYPFPGPQYLFYSLRMYDYILTHLTSFEYPYIMYSYQLHGQLDCRCWLMSVMAVAVFFIINWSSCDVLGDLSHIKYIIYGKLFPLHCTRAQQEMSCLVPCISKPQRYQLINKRMVSALWRDYWTIMCGQTDSRSNQGFLYYFMFSFVL